MARPSQFALEDYRRYIDAQISEGRRLDDISANELQTNVGGKYQKCQEMLTLVSAEIQEVQGEQPPEMPLWFKDFVATMEKTARDVAQQQWMQVGREIKRTTEEATQAFEDKLAKLRQTEASHLEAINRLEASNEALETELEQIREKLNAATLDLSIKTHDLVERDGQILKLEHMNSELSTDLRDRDKALAAADTTIKGLREKLDTQRDEYSKQIGALTNEVELLQPLANKVYPLEIQLETLKNEGKEKDKRIEKLETQVAEANGKREDLEKQLAVSNHTAESLKGSIEKLEASSKALETKLTKADQQRTAAENKASKLEGQVETLTAMLPKQKS